MSRTDGARLYHSLGHNPPAQIATPTPGVWDSTYARGDTPTQKVFKIPSLFRYQSQGCTVHYLKRTPTGAAARIRQEGY